MAREKPDLALGSSGCFVSYVSSKHNELAPCENILDGSRTTFWATTGLYPHHFTLTFPGLITINGVKIRSYFVKKMIIERSTKADPTEFEEMKSFDLPLTDLHHQVTELNFDDLSARHLRFHVKEGYEEFCAIYKVEVLGDAVEGEESRTAAMSMTSSIGATERMAPMRATSQISTAQLTTRPSLAGRQPQGMRTMQPMQGMSSVGPPTNGAPPSASSNRSQFQPNLGSLPSQPHTPVTPASTADRNSNVRNSSDIFDRLGEEDW